MFSPRGPRGGRCVMRLVACGGEIIGTFCFRWSGTYFAGFAICFVIRATAVSISAVPPQTNHQTAKRAVFCGCLGVALVCASDASLVLLNISQLQCPPLSYIVRCLAVPSEPFCRHGTATLYSANKDQSTAPFATRTESVFFFFQSFLFFFSQVAATCNLPHEPSDHTQYSTNDLTKLAA